MKEHNIHRVAFADFWPGFNPHDNLFQNILTERLNLSVTTDITQADFLIYSVFGHSHRNFPGLRLFYTAESVIPRWDACDGAVTFMRESVSVPEHHLRMPNWPVCYDIFHARNIERHPLDPDDIMRRHTKFCSFLYSNPHAQERIRFFEHLSRYKHIDSDGKVLNNTEYLVGSSFDFTSPYKFSIAFENIPSRGYGTEKIMRSFAAGSLPIYWGDPDIALDVNPSRFIHARDFDGPEELAAYIAEVDNNDELYLSYFREPLFLPGQRDFHGYMDALATFLTQTLERGIVRHLHPPHINRQPSAHGYPSMPVYDDGKPWKRTPAPPSNKQRGPLTGEYIVDCIHPQWHGHLKIRDDKAERLDPPHDTATIIDCSDTAFTLQWHRWGIERFVASGKTFHLQPAPTTGRSSHTTGEDSRILRIQSEHRPPLVYLFGAPYHSNLGDQAQTECILQLLHRDLPEHEVILSTLRNSPPRFIEAIRRHIRKDDLILCQSGYHMTDLYNEQSIYLELVKLFPDYPIRILPQPIYYKNPRIAEETAAILNRHPDCTLFCRDKLSFQTAQRLFHRCKLHLYPDLVTSMIGRMELPPHERKGILFCMRKDKESIHSAEWLHSMRKTIDSIAPTSLTDTTISQPAHDIIAHRTEVLRATIRQFSHYRAVVTDRYHGTIFSLIANTPAIVLATKGHKLTEGVKWFPDTFKQHVHPAESPAQIPGLLRSILQNGPPPPLPDHFASRYHDRFMEYLTSNITDNTHEYP